MRYFLKVRYNGTGFHGSQLQGQLTTVQKTLNDSLSLLLREAIATFGASRTDAGVHALANYYHFDTDQEINEKLQYRLNAILPSTLSVDEILRGSHPLANARFDARSRRYRYRLYRHKDPFLYQRALYYPYQIKEDRLIQTAELILAQSDFESFSKRNTQSKTFYCTILESYWERKEGELHYVVAANRFLRGMVRALVGTQLQVARGKINPADFQEIFEKRDCRLADFSVPGYGLYLEAIDYPEDCLIPLSR